MISLLKVPEHRLKELLEIDNLYRSIATDGTKSIDKAIIPYNDSNLWLLICDQYPDYFFPQMLIRLIALSDNLFEIHLGIYKNSRSKKDSKSKILCEYLLEQLKQLFGKNVTLITYIAEHNKHALKLAQAMHFVQLGKTKKTIDNKYNQYILMREPN